MVCSVTLHEYVLNIAQVTIYCTGHCIYCTGHIEWPRADSVKWVLSVQCTKYSTLAAFDHSP